MAQIVTTTDEKVRKAASECSDAKRILQILFPEVFKVLQFSPDKYYLLEFEYPVKKGKLYLMNSTHSKDFAWVALGGTTGEGERETWNGYKPTGQQLIDSMQHSTFRHKIHAFKTQKELLKWIVDSQLNN